MRVSLGYAGEYTQLISNGKGLCRLCCACGNSLADDGCTGGIVLCKRPTLTCFAAFSHDKVPTHPLVDAPATLKKKITGCAHILTADKRFLFVFGATVLVL